MTWQMEFRTRAYRLLGTELGAQRVSKDCWAVFQGHYQLSYHSTLREAKQVAEQMDLQAQLEERLRDEGSHRGDAPLSARREDA